MKLGLNLSFAVKRWLDPVELAKMIKEDFGVDHVQFTWDLIDPWWPQAQRDVMVYQYKDAFADAGITIDATFGGLASYSYAHLLAPIKVQRDIAFTFFKRAIDMTVDMGAKSWEHLSVVWSTMMREILRDVKNFIRICLSI